MTWQVPGATVEITEFPGNASEPPTFAVTVDIEAGNGRRAFDPNTATALAACLIDAGHRCDQRTAHAIEQIRKRASVTASIRRTGEDVPGRGIRDDVDHHELIARGYAADLGSDFRD